MCVGMVPNKLELEGISSYLEGFRQWVQNEILQASSSTLDREVSYPPERAAFAAMFRQHANLSCSGHWHVGHVGQLAFWRTTLCMHAPGTNHLLLVWGFPMFWSSGVLRRGWRLWGCQFFVGMEFFVHWDTKDRFWRLTRNTNQSSWKSVSSSAWAARWLALFVQTKSHSWIEMLSHTSLCAHGHVDCVFYFSSEQLAFLHVCSGAGGRSHEYSGILQACACICSLVWARITCRLSPQNTHKRLQTRMHRIKRNVFEVIANTYVHLFQSLIIKTHMHCIAGPNQWPHRASIQRSHSCAQDVAHQLHGRRWQESQAKVWRRDAQIRQVLCVWCVWCVCCVCCESLCFVCFWASMCVCVCVVCFCVCLWMSVYVCMYVCTCMYVRIYIYICLCICVSYTCVLTTHILTDTHAYIHGRTCIHRKVLRTVGSFVNMYVWSVYMYVCSYIYHTCA